ELSRLSSQLRRLYGSNRHSPNPVHLYFCSFSPADAFYQICASKNDGFSSYIVEMTAEAPEDLFDLEDIIYLSPDSENALETLDSNKVYVIGGIVDDTVKKNLSLNHAKNFNIRSARLPIPEYLAPYSSNPGATVLTVNQVFDILLKYYETKDWTEALGSHVPLRKGYCTPSRRDGLSQETEETSNGVYF
ncbi:tRNA methyltransferase 10 homolog B, partial [Trichonephila inaurata madagascariensis]